MNIGIDRTESWRAGMRADMDGAAHIVELGGPKQATRRAKGAALRLGKK